MNLRLFAVSAILGTALSAAAAPGQTSWDFSIDQPDWNKARHLTAIGTEKGLELDVKGYDSNIGNYQMDIDPVKYPKIKIVYTASGFNGKTNGEIFFTGERTKTFGKAGYFRIPSLICDGKEHTIILDANKDLPAGARMWFSEKRIKQLRLDMVNEFPGKIILKKVEFLPDEEFGKTSWDFSKNQPGWGSPRHLTMTPTAQGLLLKVAKSDSQIANTKVAIPCEKFTKVKIVYTAKGFKGKTSGELYFANSHDNFSDLRKFVLPSLISDGKKHTIMLDINKNVPGGSKVWFNVKTVGKLRLDMVNEFPGEILLKKVEFLSTMSVQPITRLDQTNIRKGYFLCLGESEPASLTIPAGNYKFYLYGAENPAAAIAQLKKLPGFKSVATVRPQEWLLGGSCNIKQASKLSLQFKDPVAGLLITPENTVPQRIDPGVKFQLESEVLSPVAPQKYLPMDENMPYWQSRMAAAPDKWNVVGHSLVRRNFRLDKAIKNAFLQITADDQVDEIYINGKKIRGIWTQDWQYPSSVEVTKYLQPGNNLLAVKYTNTGLSGGLMFDLTVNFTDKTHKIIAIDGSEKILFQGSTANWFATEFDDSTWSRPALRNGPPYAPYSSRILDYIDYTIPRGNLQAEAVLPADNQRDAFRLHLTLQGTPKISEDEIVYARLYPANRNKDTQPLCFISKKISELKILDRSNGRYRLEISGMNLPEYGGKFDGIIEYGIYYRQNTGKNSIAITLPDNPYPNSHVPIKVSVDKSGHSPVIKVDDKPFYPTFLSIFYPKYPTGLTGKNSPVKVREFLAGHSTMAWWVGPGKYDFTKIDERICQIIRDYPDSLVAAWVWCQPPHWYDKAYPERISRDSKGKVFPYYMSTVTFSDPEYRKDAAAAIKAFVEHCEKYFGNKMFAYNLAGGISLEWQGWGCHSMGKRKVFNDYSVSAQRDFLNFARQRYPELNINKVPTYEERAIDRGTAFRDPVKDIAAIIYEEYYSDSISDCIAICARAAKTASARNKLVGAYYGYYFEYGNMAYCVNGAGHNSVYKLLKNPDIDFLLSPPSYGVRAPGEPGADMKVFGSIIAAGKFSILEDDTRTHLTTPADHHQTINAQETSNVLRRNWGMSLARRQPICMLPIHEGRDFSSPAVRHELGQAQAMGQKLFESDRPSGVEIAVVVDEKALKYLRPDNQLHQVKEFKHYRYSQDGKLQINPHYEQNITGPLTFFQRMTLSRIGAGSDFIYLEDVPRLADKYKFFIFLADFAASKEFTAAIEALKKRNVGVLIAYGAAFTGRSKDVDAELMSQELGMQFKRTAAGPLKINITDTTSFAPGELQQLCYGPEYTTDPRFAVIDKNANIMGHYSDNKAAALAAKKVGKMQLYFSGSTHLTADLMRALARKSGVFINHNGNDHLFAGYGIYTLYTVRAGKKTIYFPHKAKLVTDVFTGEVLGRNVENITLDMPAHATLVIYAD